MSFFFLAHPVYIYIYIGSEENQYSGIRPFNINMH